MIIRFTQSNTDSSNSVGKLHVFEYAAFECLKIRQPRDVGRHNSERLFQTDTTLSVKKLHVQHSNKMAVAR